MTTIRPIHPHKIFLAVDGSEHSLAAIKLLLELPLPKDSAITALAALAPGHTTRRMTMLAVLDQTQALLKQKSIHVETGLLHGNPAEALTKFADDHNPDLLVLGAKGLRATLGILLGGVAQQVVEYARWPVLVVRAPYAGLRRILLVTDGSSYSERAVDYLAGFPLPASAEVRLLHVLPPFPLPEAPLSSWPIGTEVLPPTPPREIEAAELSKIEAEEEQAGQGILAKTVERLKSSGVEATSLLLRGDAATEIIEHIKANQIDLVVSGSRGLGRVRGWLLGSVSRKLVHYAPCSVLIVRGRPESAE